jgi:hypothetical protein
MYFAIHCPTISCWVEGSLLNNDPEMFDFERRLKKMDEYDQGDRGVKYAIMASIVHLLKEEGGRFLKETENGGWVEVDEATARLKISHAFRSQRKALHVALKKGKSTS